MTMKTLCSFLLSLFFILPSSLSAYEDEVALIVCDNGREMLGWDLEFLRYARESVEIGACFLGGDVARLLLTAIEERLECVPTLQVYLLTTPTTMEPPEREQIIHLQENYPHNFHIQYTSSVTVIWPEITGVDNHVKMFIVDETYFSTGGTNLDEMQCSEGTSTPPRCTNKIAPLFDQFPAGMRDQDVVGRGKVLASNMRRTFYKLFALWEHYNRTGLLQKDPDFFADRSHFFEVKGQPEVELFENHPTKRLLSLTQVEPILSGPHQKECSITQAYVRLIEEAQEEIVIANVYFCPAESIFDALLAAVNRGVKLTVLTNGVSEISPAYTKYFCWANRMHYVPLIYGSRLHFWEAWRMKNKQRKNTEIYEYHVKDVLLHKKVMIVDQKICLVGSYNLGLRSHLSDYEFALVIKDPLVAADALRVHAIDKAHSRQVEPGQACNWYFDPVTSYFGELQKRFHGLL